MEKIKMDLESRVKILQNHSFDSLLSKKLAQIESAKILDSIYVKYRLTSTDLLYAQKHYNI